MQEYFPRGNLKKSTCELEDRMIAHTFPLWLLTAAKGLSKAAVGHAAFFVHDYVSHATFPGRVTALLKGRNEEDIVDPPRLLIMKVGTICSTHAADRQAPNKNHKALL